MVQQIVRLGPQNLASVRLLIFRSSPTIRRPMFSIFPSPILPTPTHATSAWQFKQANHYVVSGLAERGSAGRVGSLGANSRREPGTASAPGRRLGTRLIRRRAETNELTQKWNGFPVISPRRDGARQAADETFFENSRKMMTYYLTLLVSSGDTTIFIHIPTETQQSAAGCQRCVEVRKVKLVYECLVQRGQGGTIDDDQDTHARLGVPALH